VVSGEEQRFFIKRQLQDIGALVEAILLEPSGRNTAPQQPSLLLGFVEMGGTSSCC